MRFRQIFSALIFFFLLSSAYALSAYADFFDPYFRTKYNRINTDEMEKGEIAFKSELTFDYVFHRLGEHWVTKPDALGINKGFDYMPSAKTDNRWEDTFGQSFLFNVGLKPFDWLFAEFGFEMINDYADRYWLPVNEEHRAEVNGDRFQRLMWNNARIGIKLDWMSLTYFRNYGHQGWVRDGDMFEMLPKQDDPDNYLRTSGHHLPDYWQFKTSGVFGDLDVIYGEEAIQNYKQGIYVKYKNIFGSNFNFFYSDHIIPYGDPDERMRNFQLNTDIYFTEDKENKLQIGGLYRPFRLNRSYEYVEDEGLGKGLAGTRYIYKDGITEEKDALGGSGKLTLSKMLGLDVITLGGEYRGLVAGNRWKADASVEKQLGKTMTAHLGYFYQKPLLAAMPLVYAAGGNLPPTVFQGRGQNSPFWVWWRNTNTGFDNRETSKFSLTFTYDPTPKTWFYRYDANELAEYNLNPEEDAPFSFAAKVNMTKYSGTLDRQTYWEYDGSTVWEDAFANGTGATNRYLGSMYFLSQFVKEQTKILYDFEIGEDVPTLSAAYPDFEGVPGREDFLSPIIGYFRTSLAVKTDPYYFKIGYQKNYWGPEDWHRNFGSTYDELYLAHADRNLGEWFNVGIEYAGARKTERSVLDSIADTPSRNEMGYFDEIRVYFKVFLDALFKFGEKEKELPFEVEHDKIPPEIALKAKPERIYPAKGEQSVIEPWAYDPSGISHWEILIKDADGLVVKTYKGERDTPEQLNWDGKNETDGKICPDGLYNVSLEVWDNYLNSAVGPVCVITLMTEIKDAEVVETERGLVITLGAKVLFDFNKFSLRKGAMKTLREVANLLKMYPDNDIAVEGHTDGIGKIAYNQKLSENRAKSVQDFIVKEGIKADRIKMTGFGKLRPVASNDTAKGREQNRRVEIIILNKTQIALDEIPDNVSEEFIKVEQQSAEGMINEKK
ncbi:MAG: OmpA family protein [Endomicrobium sp.]|nr:OmpA family protein [Endomicrobium sp.]